MRDTFQNPHLVSLARHAETTNPGTYTHLIHLSGSSNGDRQASFLGNLTTQISSICAQIAADPILSTAPAINAIGFSQGGQFLRGYIERCNTPPVHNLVTFGSQHAGISEFQECSWNDFLCRGGEALLRAGKWSPFVQERLVPAQYFRDASNEDEYARYLAESNFLADVNNEREVKNATYKRNLGMLNRFVMYLFEGDRMVHPKESAWFGGVDGVGGEVVGLRESRVYKEDWLGLKGLDEKGKLVFRSTPGEHMQLDDEVLEGVFQEFFGPVEVEFDERGRGRLVDQTGV
ncbi:palmitoyl-protein thioesterase precursor [Aspergillus heteromorphus CBS 117.55]|uniref:palmitoyl-protein hydrolase n=1 Tax=Aspergillus heteromorphus CBS 117.55 TaxID=1448321 RepID=A0A317WRF4_9EURO|nr:palmitoyl-protein thioesterase precursor [Aspergillus heteromorphus CBS 117.55]PWY87508.1 palmitoyl-protein thioesterase precursor [Aspergillus heteromorphus CBS 117.55]